MDSQLFQISGSLLILTAFLLLQTHKLSADSWKYLLANFIGAIILAINATSQQQWGFLLLQVVWAIVSAYGLIRFFINHKYK